MSDSLREAHQHLMAHERELLAVGDVFFEGGERESEEATPEVFESEGEEECGEASV